MIKGDGIIHKSVQYQVWCVSCDALLDYTEYRNQAEAIKAFRQQGWKLTKVGWLCPKHKHIPKSGEK